MSRVREPRPKGKSHVIPKRLVWDAWLKVKDNGGAAALWIMLRVLCCPTVRA
jgi:hypothetical protein